MKWIKWIDTMVAVAIVALVVIARGPSAVWAIGNCGNVPCGSGFNLSSNSGGSETRVPFAACVQR